MAGADRGESRSDDPRADDLGPAGNDLLSAVREICRLHWARRGHSDVDAEERQIPHDGRQLSYLRVSYANGDFTEHAMVGVHEGPVDTATVNRYATLFAGHDEVRSTPDLVYRGDRPTPEVERFATSCRLRLHHYDHYQSALWNHAGYLAAQERRLTGDGAYPLDKYVDKRWGFLGHPPREVTASEQILRWMETDGPRFVLVLGDFGTGKTFLVRVLARQLAHHAKLVPVMVTMRDLEKGRTLDELLAQHMARYRPDDPFHARSFRYLLREGRVALLFDGFDELAQRPTYDRVKQHFEMLRQAADGSSAKIVVTSRHQHFATDADVLNELGRDARGMPGARIIRLFPLDDDQRRSLVKKSFDDADAASFLRDLESVPNLIELAANPRMLTFMMARRDSLARLAETGPDAAPMTAGRLYEVLLTDWLEHEVRRQTARGAAEPLSVGQRSAALRGLAVVLWQTGRDSVPLSELGGFAESIADLAAWQVRPGEVTHTIGSGTVLVRTPEERFAFIHQSVMEWFVAHTVRLALAGQEPAAVNRLLADNALSSLMVDFLCDLAGTQSPVDWARDTVQRPDDPGPQAKANAALILQRTNTQLDIRQTGGRIVFANYAGQDLRGQDLSRHNLASADLSGAELDGAVLPRNLTHANLRGARLAGAQLDGADLTGADLRGADLRGARLTGAILLGARLTGAKLDRAVLLGAAVDAYALASASVFGAALPGARPTPQFAGRSPMRALMVFCGGALLATGHLDGTVRLTDPSSGLHLRTLAGHAGRVLALAGDPHGAWLASAGDDGTVRLWDPAAGVNLASFDAHGGAVRTLAVDSRGAWLASAGDDGVVRLWDPATGAQLRACDAHAGGVWALVADPGGAWLASSSAGRDGIIRLWDPATGGQLRALEGHTLGVSALAVGPGGTWLASASSDQTVRLWDPATGTLLRTVDGYASFAQSLAVDPGGGWLASADPEGTVRLWDPATGAPLSTFTIHGGGMRTLAVDPHGAWLASAGDDGAMRFWDLPAGAQERRVEGRARRARALAVDPRGGWLASAGQERTVRLWDPATGAHLRTLEGHARWLRALAVEPSGRWLASAGHDGTVRLWDPATGAHLRTLEGHTGWVRALAVDPDGAWLASAGDDSVVRLWDPATGAHLRTLEGHTARIRALAVDPRGEWLVSASIDETIRIWDSRARLFWRQRSLVLRKEGHTGGVRTLAVDPHGTWLASAGMDRLVQLWDPESGQPGRTLEGHLGAVRALAVAPDGAWLASGGHDRIIRLWDPRTGEQLRVLEGHFGAVRALAVSSDGTRLASAGEDGTVRIWDPGTGELLTVRVGDDDGWAVIHPGDGYRVEGAPTAVWWVAGLCRFESGEIDEIAQYVPDLQRLTDDEQPGESAGTR